MRRKYVIDPATDALVIVDVQGAFMSGGGLPVADAEAVLPVIARIQPLFGKVWASVDCHPAGHVSLASSYLGYAPLSLLTIDVVLGWNGNCHRIGTAARFDLHELRHYLKRVQAQVLWPDHAVEGSGEEKLHREIAGISGLRVIVKGTDPGCDSYSAFTDNLKRPTGLSDDLRDAGVRRVFCCGLAEDFCVGWTALDAADEGFEAYVIADATRPVDTPPSGNDPGSLAAVRKRFADEGVQYVDSDQLSSW